MELTNTLESLSEAQNRASQSFWKCEEPPDRALPAHAHTRRTQAAGAALQQRFERHGVRHRPGLIWHDGDDHGVRIAARGDHRGGQQQQQQRRRGGRALRLARPLLHKGLPRAAPRDIFQAKGRAQAPTPPGLRSASSAPIPRPSSWPPKPCRVLAIRFFSGCEVCTLMPRCPVPDVDSRADSSFWRKPPM